MFKGMKTQLHLGLDSGSNVNLSLDLTTLTLSQRNNLSLKSNTCRNRKTTVDIKTDHLKVIEQRNISVLQMDALSALLGKHGALFLKHRRTLAQFHQSSSLSPSQTMSQFRGLFADHPR